MTFWRVRESFNILVIGKRLAVLLLAVAIQHAEPGAAAGRGRHVGFWDFAAHSGGCRC